MLTVSEFEAPMQFKTCTIITLLGNVCRSLSEFVKGNETDEIVDEKVQMLAILFNLPTKVVFANTRYTVMVSHRENPEMWGQILLKCLKEEQKDLGVKS